MKIALLLLLVVNVVLACHNSPVFSYDNPLFGPLPLPDSIQPIQHVWSVKLVPLSRIVDTQCTWKSASYVVDSATVPETLWNTTGYMISTSTDSIVASATDSNYIMVISGIISHSDSVYWFGLPSKYQTYSYPVLHDTVKGVAVSDTTIVANWGGIYQGMLFIRFGVSMTTGINRVAATVNCSKDTLWNWRPISFHALLSISDQPPSRAIFQSRKSPEATLTVPASKYYDVRGRLISGRKLTGYRRVLIHCF